MQSKQPKSRTRRRVLAYLLVIVGVYLLFCYNAARGYISPIRHVSPPPPKGLVELDVPTTQGQTPSWATPDLADGKPSELVFVLAHGYGGSRDRWAKPMEDLKKAGFDSVALSMPGQDASPVKRVGFGLTEAQTIVDACAWARSRGTKKVVVLGISMGGSAAWIASAKDPTIDGIISEGAFASFSEAMDRFFNRKIPGGGIVLAPVVTYAKYMTGLKPETVRPVEQAALWVGKPALVIQGGEDTLMVRSQAERLSQAAGCPMWVVPGAQHAACYETDPKGYVLHVTEFAKKLIASSK